MATASCPAAADEKCGSRDGLVSRRHLWDARRERNLSGVRIGWSRKLLFPEWSPLHGSRVLAGMTQGELAAIVGASRKTISSIERGASIPSVTLALALARALDTTVEELFAADELR
jgi:putative transcriptional regulator